MMDFRNPLNRFTRDDRGAAMVMVAISTVMLFGFAVLAIDIGVLAVTKTQLQNAADAGALAGAMVLATTGDSVAAVNAAVEFAGLNKAIVNDGVNPFNKLGACTISDTDVTFPEPGLVRVKTHRDSATGDPLRTYFLRVVGGSGLSAMRASAAARFLWVCGGNCVKPWCPPDRWDDADGDGEFDPGEYYDPIQTGYTDAKDLGTQITLVLGNGAQEGFGEFWYYSIDFPPINDGVPIPGGATYEEWIKRCVDPSVVVGPGDSVQVEPGKMTGPNDKGLKWLMGLDPPAEWDPATGTVINSLYSTSPRVVRVALFDPGLGLRSDANGRKYLVIVKIIVVFIEERQGNDQFTGRFMRLNTPGGEICEDQTEPSFLYKSALVE